MNFEKWMFGVPLSYKEKALKFLSEEGFTHISLPTNEEVIKLAKDYGFKVYIHYASFGIKDKSKVDYLAVDIFNRRQIWFNSGCPNNPNLRKEKLIWLENVLTKLDIDGVLMDGIRFASPGSGINAFFTCFCEHCVNKAKELGYDLEIVRKKLIELYKNMQNPRFIKYLKTITKSLALSLDLLIDYKEILDWLDFRAKCICEYVTEVRNLVKSLGNLELGAYVFAPSLSELVGQDYKLLSRYFDIFQPMIYRIGKGVACLNYEMAILARDIAQLSGIKPENALKIVYRILGMNLPNLPRNITDLMNKGLPMKVVYLEALRATRLTSRRVVPIIMLKDEKVVELVKDVIRANCHGINFFAYREGMDNKIRKIVKVLSFMS